MQRNEIVRFTTKKKKNTASNKFFTRLLLCRLNGKADICIDVYLLHKKRKFIKALIKLGIFKCHEGIRRKKQAAESEGMIPLVDEGWKVSIKYYQPFVDT